MPLEDEGIAFSFGLQEQHMRSLCEANTAAGPTHHTNFVYSVYFLACMDSHLIHTKCNSCHDSVNPCFSDIVSAPMEIGSLSTF